MIFVPYYDTPPNYRIFLIKSRNFLLSLSETSPIEIAYNESSIDLPIDLMQKTIFIPEFMMENKWYI